MQDLPDEMRHIGRFRMQDNRSLNQILSELRQLVQAPSCQRRDFA